MALIGHGAGVGIIITATKEMEEAERWIISGKVRLDEVV